MDADIDTLRRLALEGAADFPDEIRDDWLSYFERTVVDLWSRPAMSPRNRSIVTIAALATMGADVELRAHVHLALRHGLSREEICEVVMQVGGYGGLGRAADAMRVVRAAFDDAPDLRPDGRRTEPMSPPGRDDRERLARAHDTMSLMRPPGIEMILAMIDAELSDVRPEGQRTPSGWSMWLNRTAFGDLWSRGNLTLDERERATLTTLTVLALAPELRPHFTIALNLGISPEELMELMIHIAVYAGFPTMVDAVQPAAAVIAEYGTGTTTGP